MFGTIYLAKMKKSLPACLLLLLTCLTLPVAAQYRTEMRTADKEFELHAYNLAIASYKRVLAVRPDDEMALSRIAQSYQMLNKLDTAQIYYQRAVSGHQVAPDVLLSYAQTLKSLGRYDQAKFLFEAYAEETDATVGGQYARSIDFAQRQQNEDAGFTVTNLSVNSPAADFGADVARPGQLVFNSSRLEGDFSGVAVTVPYVAGIGPDGSVAEAVILSTGYTSRSGEVGPVSYSPDGTRVVFTRNNFTPGTRLVPEAGITLNLLIADVNGAGQWVNVRPLPFNGNDFNTGFGTFGADGSTIYFASDRPGGYGGYDLYRIGVSGNDGGTVPENLGPVVNSRGNEITPFFDGTSVYFSSDWHQGLGAYDVFRAAMADGKPTALYHLGGAVNSPRDDMGFTFDPATGRGYVTSNRPGGRGEEDIYAVVLRDLPATATAEGKATAGNGPSTGVPTGVNANAPVPFGTVRGYVSDIETGAPVAEASVTITMRSTGQAASVRSDVEGAYYVEVRPMTIYDVDVAAEGYEPMNFPVTTDDGKNPNVFGNIGLLPAQGGVEEAAAPAPQTYNSGTVAPPPPTNPTAPPAENSAAAREGFAVQLASLVEAPEMAAYANLAPLGRVYTALADGRYKVRLGTFATREEATAAVARVQQLGYAGTFVVADAGPAPSPVEPPVTPEPSPTPAADTAASVTPPAPAPAPAPATPPGTPEAAPAARSPFRVQLGAFSKPENFDRATAAGIGTLASDIRGNLTIFYLDDVQTLSQAESLRNRALAAGYVGAYILKFNGEKYVNQ